MSHEREIARLREAIGDADTSPEPLPDGLFLAAAGLGPGHLATGFGGGRLGGCVRPVRDSGVPDPCRASVPEHGQAHGRSFSGTSFSSGPVFPARNAR